MRPELPAAWCILPFNNISKNIIKWLTLKNLCTDWFVTVSQTSAEVCFACRNPAWDIQVGVYVLRNACIHSFTPKSVPPTNDEYVQLIRPPTIAIYWHMQMPPPEIHVDRLKKKTP